MRFSSIYHLQHCTISMHTMSTIRWLLLARRMGERNFKTNGNVFLRFDGAGTVTRPNLHSPPELEAYQSLYIPRTCAYLVSLNRAVNSPPMNVVYSCSRPVVMRMRVVEVDKFETENVLGVDTGTLSPNRQSHRILQGMETLLQPHTPQGNASHPPPSPPTELRLKSKFVAIDDRR
jgi:hypothetical protein